MRAGSCNAPGYSASLNPGVQKTKDGMTGVVIQEQAFALARLELQVLGVSVAIDLEAAARLDAGQHTHTGPLVIPSSAAIRRAIFSLLTVDEAR